jgi:hypothetical protein
MKTIKKNASADGSTVRGLHIHTLIIRKVGWSGLYNPERDSVPMVKEAGWASEIV